MNKKNLEGELYELIGTGLSQQADSIDSQMLGRLRRARVEAVSQQHETAWLPRLWHSISANSLVSAPVAQASVAVLVAVFSISLVLAPQHKTGNSLSSGVDIQQNEHRALSEMDVLMSNEDIEFLENLEIYEWLAAEYG